MGPKMAPVCFSCHQHWGRFLTPKLGPRNSGLTRLVGCFFWVRGLRFRATEFFRSLFLARSFGPQQHVRPHAHPHTIVMLGDVARAPAISVESNVCSAARQCSQSAAARLSDAARPTSCTDARVENCSCAVLYLARKLRSPSLFVAHYLPGAHPLGKTLTPLGGHSMGATLGMAACT